MKDAVPFSHLVIWYSNLFRVSSFDIRILPEHDFSFRHDLSDGRIQRHGGRYALPLRTLLRLLPHRRQRGGPPRTMEIADARLALLYEEFQQAGIRCPPMYFKECT
jgi:hypothetical protein